jgi:hypothetical protein
MNQLYEEQVRTKCFGRFMAFMDMKQAIRSLVGLNVMKIIEYLNVLEKLEVKFDLKLRKDIILRSLSEDFRNFMDNY